MQLRQQAGDVDLIPMLGNEAFADPKDRDAARADLPVGGLDAQKLPLMGPASRHARNDGVALCDQVVQLVSAIGRCCKEVLEAGLEPFSVR